MRAGLQIDVVNAPQEFVTEHFYQLCGVEHWMKNWTITIDPHRYALSPNKKCGILYKIDFDVAPIFQDGALLGIRLTPRPEDMAIIEKDFHLIREHRKELDVMDYVP